MQAILDPRSRSNKPRDIPEAVSPLPSLTPEALIFTEIACDSIVSRPFAASWGSRN